MPDHIFEIRPCSTLSLQLVIVKLGGQKLIQSKAGSSEQLLVLAAVSLKRERLKSMELAHWSTLAYVQIELRELESVNTRFD